MTSVSPLSALFISQVPTILAAFTMSRNSQENCLRYFLVENNSCLFRMLLCGKRCNAMQCNDFSTNEQGQFLFSKIEKSCIVSFVHVYKGRKCWNKKRTVIYY